MRLPEPRLAAALALLAFVAACSPKPAPAPPPDPATVAGREPESYSATVVRTFERGDERTVAETRFARDGGRVREEWIEARGRLAALVRPDLDRTFLVDLDRNVYVETAMAPPEPDASAVEGEAFDELFHGSVPEATVERVRGGVEDVNGYACVVVRSRIEAPSGGTSEATVWEAGDLGGLALRSEVRGPQGDRVVTELRDLRVPADPALFELPPGSRRVHALEGP
jgi:hypothetical protein